VKKETGQAIATMAETNEGTTTVMTDEEHFHSEYLKNIYNYFVINMFYMYQCSITFIWK
jgi:hypothetical protein